jgi:hypothetical protein
MIRIYRSYSWILLISAGLFFAYHIFFKDDPQPKSHHAEQHNRAVAEQVAGSLSKISTGASWGASPFTGTASAKEIAAEVAAMRYEKMKKLGYETPAKYYDMNLVQLRELSKKGDAYAMIQLAEQYYSETDYIKNDPNFDKSRKPQDIALGYFEDAMRAGYTHAASIVSMEMAGENKPVDAYAWRMLSDRFNDHANDTIYNSYVSFDKMSDMDKAEARGKLDAIWHRFEAGRN